MTDVILMTDHTDDKAWKSSHPLAPIKPDLSTGFISPGPQERIDCPSLKFCFGSKLNSLSKRQASYYSHITWSSHLRLPFFTTMLPHWKFSNGKFRLLSPGKASCDRVTLPNLWRILPVISVSIINQTLTWTSGPFTCAQMLMHATAHRDGQTL